ncbi:MAG: hypothetical protein ACI9U0_002056 [Flavobacteriales bacterium]|jgi:hypothetical protein|tara:strand:- start:499 stop:657 length:159 start_codon:yes stop_codon:yes gene_type:complete
MLSFNECKKILNSNENTYTDNQVKEINEFSEMMADIIISNDLLRKFKNKQNE